MDFSSTAYTLLDLLAAGLIGLVIGRMTARRSDPRHAETLKQRQRAAQHETERNLAGLKSSTRAQLEHLVKNGRIIEAVRDCRAELKIGLKEAKDVVDRLKELIDRDARTS